MLYDEASNTACWPLPTVPFHNANAFVVYWALLPIPPLYADSICTCIGFSQLFCCFLSFTNRPEFHTRLDTVNAL